MLQFASKLAGAVAAVALLSYAFAQPQTSGVAAQPDVLLTLGNHDGIFVDKKTFKAIKGNGAHANAASLLAKLDAKEVSAGAMIYRLDEKLYIVDGTPPANASPQLLIELKDWCPSCTWEQVNRQLP